MIIRHLSIEVEVPSRSADSMVAADRQLKETLFYQTAKQMADMEGVSLGVSFHVRSKSKLQQDHWKKSRERVS